MLLTGRTTTSVEDASILSDRADLRSKPDSRSTHRVVSGLSGSPLFPAPAALREARIIDPSMHQRSQSILPCSSSRISSRSNTRSQIPANLHLRKWSYTVDQGP